MAGESDIDTAKLRALAEAATPVLDKDLMRYDHGGGRLAILRDGERKLIADFYGDGGDREFYAAANPATILSLLDQIDALKAQVGELQRIASLTAAAEAAEGRVGVTFAEKAEAARLAYTSRDGEVARLEAQLAERDAEIARLREALEPFRRAAGWYFSRNFNAGDTVASFTVGDLRRAALAAVPAPARDLAAENARLREAITASQAVLAEYIAPGSGISERAVVNDLLGILDHRDLVGLMRRAAFSPPQQAGSETGEAWRSIETAPEDEHVILATTGGFVGEALMLRDENTGTQKWTWALGPVHQNHVPLGWQPMPDAPKRGVK